jgi:hypothetical protein
MTHLLLLVILLVPLASLAQVPSPPPDWIDEFPSVTEVAHAAYEELKVTAQRSGIDPNDDDSIAINLAGTFVVLRQIMLLKYNEEPPMAKNREEKLRKLVASYLEAELTIGRGWAGRRGYIMRGPPTGMGCSDEACYRRWFLLHLNASSGRAEYRQRVLSRLFPCGTLAEELNDLRQKHATTVPYMPSPATTLRMEREVVGVGPTGCAAYGGDSRQRGLCDGWTPPPAPSAGPIASEPGVAAATALAAPASAGAPASSAFRRSGSGCLIIALTKVRMAKNAGLLVSIDPTSAKAGDVVTFRVSRSKEKTPDGSPAIWEKQATIAQGGTALEAVVATTGVSLVPDPTRPFLIIDTTSTSSRGPTHCEQPTTQWQTRHDEKPHPKGLHGPYASVEEAARQDNASSIALRLTARSSIEHGFVIVRDLRATKPAYYTTPPLFSSSGAPGVYLNTQPQFQAADFKVSFERAFEGSCENAEDFTIAATVHTHPSSPMPNMFSGDDFHQAITLEQFTHFADCPSVRDPVTRWLCTNARGFELAVLLNQDDGTTRTFRPCPNDEDFGSVELDVASLTPWLSPLWNRYCRRTDVITGTARSRACKPPATNNTPFQVICP